MLLCVPLSGCLSNLSLEDAASGGGAVIGAGLSSLVGLPPAGVIGTSVVTGTAGAVLIGPSEAGILDPSTCETPECFHAFETQKMWVAIKDILHWIIGGGVLLLGVLMYLGYRVPRRREKKLEQMLKDSPLHEASHCNVGFKRKEKQR